MTTIGDLLTVLEQIAPLAYQENYDNAGLLVGQRTTVIQGVLICLDAIEAIIDEAIERGCNLIVAHHPIIFSGLKRFNGKNYIERVVIKAIKNDIAIYAAHTNLDNVFKQGVNAKIAERLQLKETRILAPKKELLKKLYTFVPVSQADAIKDVLFQAGAGHIGNYSECSYSTLGTGSFKGEVGSQPTIGKQGERHDEKEEKIEVIFPAFKEKGIVRALKQAHPYEEVAYDLCSIYNYSSTYN